VEMRPARRSVIFPFSSIVQKFPRARIKSLIDFAIHLVKDVMTANDMRFITKEKKRFVEMWLNWLHSAEPETKEKPLEYKVKIIATEILSGFNIKHRKTGSYPTSAPLPLNSRYKKRMHYCLRVLLTNMMKG